MLPEQVWALLFASCLSMRLHPRNDGESMTASIDMARALADRGLIEWSRRFDPRFGGGIGGDAQ